jgi:glycosyltransferase involved in cell wall biosynthesis
MDFSRSSLHISPRINTFIFYTKERRRLQASEDYPRTQQQTDLNLETLNADTAPLAPMPEDTEYFVEVSVIVPSYNEAESLPELSRGLKEVLTSISEKWEVWFIDDGSNDNSIAVLKGLHAEDARFKMVRFRRNYGKSAALAVGFKEAAGRYVITMDADLQDDPAEIPALIAKIKDGWDMVSGWKKKRYDPISKTIPSRFFNFVTARMSGIDIHDFNCGLKAYRNEVIKSVNIYGEMHRYIPVLAKMAGFTVSELVVHHHPRKYGKTKFGLSRFFKGFLDLLTVMFTSRYTQRPLHVFGTLGGGMLFAGFVINAWLTIEWLMGYPVGNRPMLMLGVLLMLLGIQLISTGLLAEMITKNDADVHDYKIRQKLN